MFSPQGLASVLMFCWDHCGQSKPLDFSVFIVTKRAFTHSLMQALKYSHHELWIELSFLELRFRCFYNKLVLGPENWRLGLGLFYYYLFETVFFGVNLFIVMLIITIHPLSIPALPVQGCKGVGAYSSWHWARDGVHPGHTHIHLWAISVEKS